MGKLRQPKDLETLAIEASAQWLCNIGENLIRQCMAPKTDEEDPRSTNKVIIEKLEIVVAVAHDLFERYVPFYLYRALTDELMKRIAELIEKCKAAIEFKANMSKFLTQVNVAVRLSETLVSVKMRTIDLEELPKMVRTAFYSKLPRMPHLCWLKLGSVTGGWKTIEMEQSLADSLKCMRNLTHLNLNYDCTDRILETLVKFCPKLMSLDIANSKLVTNESVYNLITDLKDLRVIQLYRSSVTMEGYINLLLHLPDLLDIGRYDDIGKCIEFIDEYHPTYSNFKLEYFSSNHATTKQIQILCEKFPRLNSISLFHNVLFLDLMAVIGINQLRILKLRSCDFFSDRIKDLLHVKGCNITELYLEHVDQIDMNALIYISQFCTELKTLFICNCNLIQSTSLHYRYLQLPPFMSLKNLTLIGNCSLQHLEWILVNVHKVEVIHLGSQIPTTDELFEKVFLKNELACLRELRILHSDALTVRTMYTLIHNCRNLSRLYEIESWTQVYPFQIDEVKAHIKRHNLDVDLTSYRRFVT